MSRKTKTTVSWQRVGRHAVTRFANALREMAFRDSRVADYELTLITPDYSQLTAPIALIVEIRGSVSARDFVDEVFDGEHGAW